ncbi:MAG: TIGR03960 family B12-binding radical SAM protein [Acidimicrobiia bacterium]
MWPVVEPLLPGVARPARYIGGEGNIIRKVPGPEMVRWLLVFPDAYEIGLPNLGLQILYELLNERPDAQAERAYAPWPDMAAAMRAAGVPLFSVDRHERADAFDVLAFTFPSELLYTNLLECLDLAGVPLRSQDRRRDDPLVVAGGHAVTNPEPVAEFLDAVVVGDGEDAVVDITAVVNDWRAGGGSRHELLAALARIEGVYVPSLYDVVYAPDGTVAAVEPNHPAAPERVESRRIADLADMPYPRRPLVPLTEVVHDRLNVEIFRGCTRGCRFCQAGMITRPVRERPPEQIRRMVRDGLASSGYEDVSLLSLSSADYSGAESLVGGIMDDVGGDRVSLSLPSLRVDAFGVGLASRISSVKRTGLTFAPEAGTWRMRRVVNKLVAEEDLYAAVEAAYANGWKRMKLYFMVGLPTETDEDVLGIGELGRNVVEIGKRHVKGASCTLSVGGFVPKAHTPFQWFGQARPGELEHKIGLLKDATRRTRAQLRWHDPSATTAEGIVSRGDRRLGAVIEHVWRAGGVFQEWGEHFSLDLWTRAMRAHDQDIESTVHRTRGDQEVFPWEHVGVGLRREFLWDEWREALDMNVLEDCRWTPCYDCGVCTDYGIEHLVASASPPAGGSQGTGQRLPEAGLPGAGKPVELSAKPTQTQEVATATG